MVDPWLMHTERWVRDQYLCEGWATLNPNVHSRFLALCLFLLGLLMTLIGLLGKVPMTLSGSSSDDGAMILTSASTFFFFSSTSEMKSCLPTQRPM